VVVVSFVSVSEVEGVGADRSISGSSVVPPTDFPPEEGMVEEEVIPPPKFSASPGRYNTFCGLAACSSAFFFF